LSTKLLEGLRELRAEYVKRLEEENWREDYRAKLRARVEKLQAMELDVLDWFSGR
jgi:hypothetical protein